MINGDPVVSVIVPCYNQALYLEEAVKSVINQTFSSWECIIVDDGSPDNTKEVAQSLMGSDPRIKYYWKRNGGISDARNFGVEKAVGKYVLPLDADDKINNDYLRQAYIEIENDENIKVVYSEAELFGSESGKWILPDFSYTQLARGNMIFCTSLFRKSDFLEIGGYDVNMKQGWEDWEFWINMLKRGGLVRKLHYTGFYYRIKEVSREKSITTENRSILEKYICEKHSSFIFEYLGNPIFLERKLQCAEGKLRQHAETLAYISNKFPYKVYSSLKKLFQQ